MKPPTVIAIAAALGGFAVGWIAKPSAPAAQDSVASTEAAGHNPGKSPGSDAFGGKSHQREERPMVLKPRGEEHPVEDQKTSIAQQQFERSFGTSMERQRSSDLNRLVEALGLSGDQRKIFDTLLAGRREGFKDLQGRGKTPFEMYQEAANAERIFENEVKKHLDPEQVQAYDDYKAREKTNDIERRALRDLTDLIGQVDLNETQREQALEALRKNSAQAMAKLPEGWGLINESMDVLGNKYLEAFDEMSGFLTDPEAMKSPEEVQKNMVKAKSASAKQRETILAGILTPAQLGQYRATQAARTTFLEASNPPAPTTPFKNR